MTEFITSTPELPKAVTKLKNGNIKSPIRRRSIVSHGRNKDEVRNDDDAERFSLVASERAEAITTPISSTRFSSRQSLSSPQKEHFQGCLKLYAENKINKDNAFNLQLIDFMCSMLRRHDPRMENLQSASTIMDASARIYSFRVDAIHHEILKMAGGLSKVAQSKRGKKDDDDNQADSTQSEASNQNKKKKKKSKSALTTNLQLLNADLETNETDSFFDRLAASTGDVIASNKAFNATLPIDDKTVGLMLSTDGRFLNPVMEDHKENIDLSLRNTLNKKLLQKISKEDRICEPFYKFSINNWDPETEDTEMKVNNWIEDNHLNLSQQAVAFDVNAEVEPIPNDEEHNDLYDEEPLGGISSDEEADAAVAACVARAAGGGVARLADMRPRATTDARLEYSYCAAIVSAWAGPSHWRLKNNRAARPTVTAQTQVPRRRPGRRSLDFPGAGVAFSWRAPPADYELAQPPRITISRKTLATGSTWSEANYRTPVRGIYESQFKRMFIRQNVVLLQRRELEKSKKELQAEPIADDDQKDYDYDNENDASYCPNNLTDKEKWGNEEGAAAGEVHEQRSAEDFGDLLEPPPKVAKIFIPYAMRSKKVDMKQLKHCTWKLLTKTDEGDKKTVPPTTFTRIYSQLPSMLTTNARESLSVSLALLSLLHLANEKGLVLRKTDDLKDIHIVGLINS